MTDQDAAARLMRDHVLRLESRAREEAESFGIDTSRWESLLTATSCYECGCIGCSTGCPAGGRE